MKRMTAMLALCMLTACAGTVSVQSVNSQSTALADAAYTGYAIGLEDKVTVSGVCNVPMSAACGAARSDVHAKSQLAYTTLLAVRAGSQTISALYAITGQPKGAQ